MKRSTLLLLTGIIALATIGLSGCNSDSEQSQVVRGPVTVFYDIQESPTGTVGTGPKGEEVSEIHFHTNYIILKKAGGKGTLLPLSKIKHFRWMKEKS